MFDEQYIEVKIPSMTLTYQEIMVISEKMKELSGAIGLPVMITHHIVKDGLTRRKDVSIFHPLINNTGG